MDTRRIGMMAALAVGCLVALQGVNACSSGDNRNDNTGTPDAGTGGTGGPDAGTVNTGPDHTIGGPCTAPAAGQQGDCDTGLTCIQPSDTTTPGGMCVKVGCAADADCGTGNTCVDVGSNQKACFRGCDVGVIGSCNRDGYVCQPTGGPRGVCIANCNTTGGTCPADNLACQQDGTCMPAAGNAGAFESCDTEGCQTGLNCLSFQGGSGGICFPDCTSAACPQGSTCAINFSGTSSGKACAKDCATDADCTAFSGWTCQTTSSGKSCLPPRPTGTQQAGQSCGGAAGACSSGLECLGSGTTGNCFQGPCTTDTDCTALAGSKCSISTGNNGPKFCALACTAGGAACPQGLTCKTIQTGSPTFCLQ